MSDDDPAERSGSAALVPLPAQPAGEPWPTADWTPGDLPSRAAERVTGVADRLLGPTADDRTGRTHALLVVHRCRLVLERYGTWFVGDLEALAGRTATTVQADELQLSWSMAKSVLH